MATNPPYAQTYGPYQPPPPQPPASFQQPPPPQSPAQNAPSAGQNCYNCGSPAHWAQHCPEPRRAVPAGAKQRNTTHNSRVKKPSKPVITRYAPPPGYVPPPAGPPAAVPAVPAAPAPAPAPYPQAGYTYQQAAPQVTPQWQPPPPQQYAAAPAQPWVPPPPQPPQQPAAPVYGPHHPQQLGYPHAPQSYQQPGQAPTAYPTPPTTHHSSPQGYPPQPAYPPSQHPQQPPNPYQQPYAAPVPHATPSFSPPVPFAAPHAPQPIYPQPQYQPPQPSIPVPNPPVQQRSGSGFQPYQPPPMNNSRFPPGRFQGGARHNAHNHFQNNSSNNNNKPNRNPKRFNQPQQAPDMASQPRPPSPPHFWPRPEISETKGRNGSIAWTPAQPLDRPLAATFEETEAQLKDGYVPPEDRGKNIVGSKYFDTEGNPINREEIEQNEDMKNDPVWRSVRTGETTRITMSDAKLPMDEGMEKVLDECKLNLISEEKLAARNNAKSTGTDVGDMSNDNRTDGKKRNWDEFVSKKSNHGGEQERRHGKRRHGGRNGRARNRHGNKSGNRQMGQDIAPPNQQNNPHQAPQRHVHPLPPKPPVGLPPPHIKGEDVKTHYDTQQPAKRRRSRSPLRGESSGMSWSDHIDKRLKHGREEDTLRDDVAPL